MVEDLLSEHFGNFPSGSVHRASCTAEWSDRNGQVQLVEVVPCHHPLRTGSDSDFNTQGGASFSELLIT